MTTDDDRVAYLAGEDGTELDDAARADLDDLRALLADPTIWSDPGPGLEDAVVTAIAAEAAEAARHPVAPAAPTFGSQRRTRRRSGGTRAALTAAAAVAALAAGGVVAVIAGDGDDGGSAFSLEPTDVEPGASGSGEIRQTESGWRIELDASGLPRLDDGRFYQAWLKDAADVLVPIGTFNEPRDVILWAGVSPRQFSTLTVTQEEADGDQASSGRRVLVGTIDLD